MTVERCERSWQYLESWRRDGALHGIIATFWNSDPEITPPHVMNQYPVIEGLCLLSDDWNDSAHLDRAMSLAEFLLETQDPGSGFFANAWGDVPPLQTGLVHQASTAHALLVLYERSEDDRLREAAVRTLRGCRERWNSLLMNGVANQVMKYLQAVMRLRILSPETYRELSVDVPRLIEQLDELKIAMPGGGILIAQSAYNSFLMTVYQTKCIHGLLALRDAGVESAWAEETLEALLEGIFENLYAGHGRFYSHLDRQECLRRDIVRKGAAVLRRLPWPDQGRWVERRRRAINDSITSFGCIPSPMWIARLAETALTLKRAEAVSDNPRLPEIRGEIDRNLEAEQLPHGGVPNTHGAWMSGMDAWQRQICSTRWNAYVFRYFCETATGAPDLSKRSDADEVVVWGDERVSCREDHHEVVCTEHNSGTQFRWCKPASPDFRDGV